MDIPEVPELNGHPEWTVTTRSDYEIEAALQEMAENAVDSAHFRYVHDTAAVPVLEEYTAGFPEAVMRSSQKYVTGRGVVEGRLDTHAWGPGLSLVYFSGIVDTVNYTTTTPIEADRCLVRFNFAVKSLGTAATEGVGRAFAAEVDKQVREDKPIWEHKAHLVRPALADSDGPFHEVPQVDGAVLRRAGGRRPAGLPAALLARPLRRGTGQGDGLGPPRLLRRSGVPRSHCEA